MPRTQLTSTAGKYGTSGYRLTGQKRRMYNYPSKYYSKKWSSAPGGQAGGTPITRIRQVTNLGFIQASTTDFLDCYAFRLLDLPNHADYQAMYDMYRIVKVIIHFIPFYNTCPVSGSTGQNKASILYTAKDYNSIDAPANADVVASYQTCKFSSTLEKHVRSIKPLLVAKTIPPGADAAQTLPYSPPNNVWINIDNDNEYYAGIKVALRASASGGANNGFYVEAEYHVEFKNIK